MSPLPGGLLIYDGDCGFCTSSAAWIQRRLDSSHRVVPWQELDLAPYGLAEADVASAAYWIDAGGRPHRGHLAIAESLAAASARPWHIIGTLLRYPPLSWLAAGVYRLVARYRYKLPGSTDACRLQR